uniref:C2 domain-containing protein n=1 Tax=Heterorhabditis bacteriophora TaxID=37862 RepID=A0A1I7WFF6_HETBA
MSVTIAQVLFDDSALLKSTHFESVALFSLSSAGVLSSAAHIPPGFTHDFVVVAYDKGMPPLESTALVTVSVQGTSLSSQALDIVWLTETESAHLLENITLGSIVARISLNNKQGDRLNFNSLKFETIILISYVVDLHKLVALLDCSVGPELRFRVHAEDNGHPPLYSVVFVELQVTADIVDGDNRAPQFEKSLYEINVQEDSDVGTCFLKVRLE